MMLKPLLTHIIFDLWDELLYMVIFNVICVCCLVVFPLFPFALFGLFYIAYDIGKGKAVKLSLFFSYAKQTWTLAATWGGINLLVMAILIANLAFYTGIQAQWAVVMRLLILGCIISWAVLQLIALALYPRLVEPGFKMALRNAAAVMGLSPALVFLLTLWIAVVITISVFLPPLAILLSIAAVVIFTNRVVETVVKQAFPEAADS